MTQACHRIRCSMAYQSIRCTHTYQIGTHPSEIGMVYNFDSQCCPTLWHNVSNGLEIISAGRHEARGQHRKLAGKWRGKWPAVYMCQMATKRSCFAVSDQSIGVRSVCIRSPERFPSLGRVTTDLSSSRMLWRLACHNRSLGLQV